MGSFLILITEVQLDVRGVSCDFWIYVYSGFFIRVTQKPKVTLRHCQQSIFSFIPPHRNYVLAFFPLSAFMDEFLYFQVGPLWTC